MIEVLLPGEAPIRLSKIVCDFNGSIARDGILLPGIAMRLRRLAARIDVHVLSGDSHGTVRSELDGLPLHVEIVGDTAQAAAKLAYIRKLGPEGCIVIGNGRNDALMMQEARLSIAILGCEGCAQSALRSAAVVCRSATDALDLPLHPLRIRASLRS